MASFLISKKPIAPPVYRICAYILAPRHDGRFVTSMAFQLVIPRTGTRSRHADMVGCPQWSIFGRWRSDVRHDATQRAGYRNNLGRTLTTATRLNVLRTGVTRDPYDPIIARWWLRARRASPTVTVVRRIVAEPSNRRRLRSFSRGPRRTVAVPSTIGGGCGTSGTNVAAR